MEYLYSEWQDEDEGCIGVLRRRSKIILSTSKHHTIRGGGLEAYIALAILDLACVPRTGQRRTATVVRGDR